MDRKMECPICKKKAVFVGVHDDEGNYYCSVRVYRLSYLAIDDRGTEYMITMEYIKSNEANPEEIGLNYVSIFKTDPDSDEIIRAGRTWE